MEAAPHILRKQPWIESAAFDCVFILSPAILATSLVLLFSSSYAAVAHDVPLWAWVVLIMGIDVSHVYSTLYRTYFDPEERERYRSLLWGIPLACWVVGVMLYSMGAEFFWTVLAYVAAFHFVRQQYGFTMIYARREKSGGVHGILLDRAAIYAATLYPLLYWHTHLPRRFNWFIEGDFVGGLPPLVERVSFYLYAVILIVYAVREAARAVRTKVFNFPKNAFVWGTVAAWYVGIVAFNADLPFTVTNVVSHGIPYMGLVWLYGRRKWKEREARGASAPLVAKLHRVNFLPAFLLLLLVLAYIEEGIWDRALWREHAELFSWFTIIPNLSEASILSLLIPLLAVPQATHYVLDAFIWRVRKPDPGFQALLDTKGGAYS